MRKLAPEVAKSDYARKYSGFYETYMKGMGADVGYRGGNSADPVVPNALGIDLGTPGYDGTRLPFPDKTLDFVFSSHCFEHIQNRVEVLRDWYRTLKQGGYLILTVPHQHLYEKRNSLPSKFNGDHKIFYTPGILLREVEEALEPNSYRVVLLRDNDTDYSYDLGPDVHCRGACEIELVLQKREKPQWDIE